MSIIKNIQQVIQKALTALQRLVSYIWEAAKRIFSPSDDQYPKTGVQPFEGDPAKD